MLDLTSSHEVSWCIPNSYDLSIITTQKDQRCSECHIMAMWFPSVSCRRVSQGELLHCPSNVDPWGVFNEIKDITKGAFSWKTKVCRNKCRVKPTDLTWPRKLIFANGILLSPAGFWNRQGLSPMVFYYRQLQNIFAIGASGDWQR